MSVRGCERRGDCVGQTSPFPPKALSLPVPLASGTAIASSIFVLPVSVFSGSSVVRTFKDPLKARTGHTKEIINVALVLSRSPAS